MENKFWRKIIYLPTFIQWALTLGTVILSGIFLLFYFLLPPYNHQNEQLVFLQTSRNDASQRLNVYRQAKPYYMISKQLARLESGQVEAFPIFILSYGTAVANWQESGTQQKATLVLGWQDFLQFWQHLTQLNRKMKPDQLQLSAHDGPILVKLTYDKN
ncbi:hypothetical protein SAMN05216522_11036 [Rosenbergiella nectarea]|uniref:Uncharacterized protein n=1 Tax=Rosenbergiella nectarea TaxID=988801 RepID=A0A1H9KUR0_9GAMM|nr:hypothetical protein SAMN05216522_11036 [Rosenbergiella nectarea]